MISRGELVKYVAEVCGIAPEISTYFFEVFINRLGSKLKVGEIVHFENVGYFQKRNCRLQLEKTSDSPTGKSYLLQLILFSLEPEAKGDISSVHFLKIPNLKALWVNDKDFQNSLRAGEFFPYSDRNELIKSFATKAEVIITGAHKDYYTELEQEITIPLTLDLNFILKTGQQAGLAFKKEDDQKLKTVLDSHEREQLKEDDKKLKSKDVNIEPDQSKEKTLSDNALPWNHGTRFLDKKSTQKSEQDEEKKEPVTHDDIASKLTDFEAIPTQFSKDVEGTNLSEVADDDKSTQGKKKGTEPEYLKIDQKFIEVKSKTEAFKLVDDFETLKQKKLGEDDSVPSIAGGLDKYDNYSERKNFLPLIIISIIVILASILIYIFFLREEAIEKETDGIVFNVNPPANVKIIDRDFEFAITYPYPKIEASLEIIGYNPDTYSEKEVKLEPTKKVEESSKLVVKEKINLEKKQTSTPEIKEEMSSRIFLYKNFYVVYAGSFKSLKTAEKEAERYNNMGYNAFVETVEIKGNPTVYKVNVGDFTSEDFARGFELKYLK